MFRGQIVNIAGPAFVNFRRCRLHLFNTHVALTSLILNEIRRADVKEKNVSRMCEQPLNTVPFCTIPHKKLEFWKHITRSFIGGAQDRGEHNTV